MFNNNSIEVPKAQKLNLVPIMDAIFLFIFFLLTSSQVIKFFEINSDAPVVQESSSASLDDSLQLKIKIRSDLLTLYKGANERKIAVIPLGNVKAGMQKFSKQLVGLKRAYPTEKEVILSPDRDVDFQKIVKVMDIVRSKHRLRKDSDKVPLFPNIVLEPMQ